MMTRFFFPTLAATFVSFLLEVDSIYEVHDYIKSYLGETPEAHDFAKQFLERRQKLKPPANLQSQVRVFLVLKVHCNCSC